MSSPADPVIAALRTGHDALAAIVPTLSDEQLTGPSACSDWDVSQVLSHLGSGAEISLGALRRALDPGSPAVENTEVWDRWNAMSPQERAAAVLPANAAVVAAYEGLDQQSRNALRIDLGFLPQPVDVATAAGLRLNEFALHSWDVRVVLDSAATLPSDAAAALVDRSGMLLGRIGHADAAPAPVTLTVRTTDPERTFGLAITDAVSMTDAPEQAGGTLRLPAEAWLRLTTGRLDAAHTPGSVELDGPLGLDDLRRVFPGF